MPDDNVYDLTFDPDLAAFYCAKALAEIAKDRDCLHFRIIHPDELPRCFGRDLLAETRQLDVKFPEGFFRLIPHATSADGNGPITDMWVFAQESQTVGIARIARSQAA
jgi:hypothetical protein